MSAGIFYGSMYGDHVDPGQYSRRGCVRCDLCLTVIRWRCGAGPALGIAAFGSFIAGTLGIVGLIFELTRSAEFALNRAAPSISP